MGKSLKNADDSHTATSGGESVRKTPTLIISMSDVKKSFKEFKD
jgi:hypothetical protein